MNLRQKLLLLLSLTGDALGDINGKADAPGDVPPGIPQRFDMGVEDTPSVGVWVTHRVASEGRAVSLQRRVRRIA